MRLRRTAALASLAWLACGLFLFGPAEAAVGRLESRETTLASNHSASSDLFTKVVRGRVHRLEYRVANGYPVTDVYLEPSGEVFTILGGIQDGVLWAAEEEPSFGLGDEIEISLERSPDGWRPSPRDADLPQLPAWTRDVEPVRPGMVPRVLEIVPSTVPAVADADHVVEIRGRNFGLRQGLGAVLFQGLFEHVPAEILSWSEDRIRCLVPKPGLFNTPQVLTGALKVWTPLGGWSDGMEWEGKRLVIPFQYAGDRYADEKLPIPVYFNMAGFPWPEEAVRDVLERSIGSWNEVDESYAAFALEGTVDAVGGRRRDGVNVVSWTDPWPHPEVWLAVTWSAFDARTGLRIETDVEINSTVAWSVADAPVSGAYDLRSVMTHEFGHWLRLGHVQNPRSVMNSFISRSEAVWRLEPGDRMGAAWVYPSYGTVSASPSRLAAGASQPLVLSVRAVDRLGGARAGLPAEEIYAHLTWENPPGSALRPGATQTLGPFHANRAADGEGRTEILIPAPDAEGRARITVFAAGTPLVSQPSVEFTRDGEAEPGTSELRVLGPHPARGAVVRAEVRLASGGGPWRARLYDARGRVVLERDLGRLEAGVHEIPLTLGAHSVAGVYFLEVAAATARQVTKFVWVR